MSEDFHAKLKEAVARELAVHKELAEHILEIDRRKLIDRKLEMPTSTAVGISR